MLRIRELICLLCPLVSVLSIDLVASLKNSSTVAIPIAEHQHHHQRKGNDGHITYARQMLSSYHDIRRRGERDSALASPIRASKKLLQLMRLLYLTYYASLGALMPYLPVYFHSLGHPGSAIGLLGAVRPLTTFLVAPLWGVLSDRSNNHVSTLQFTFVSSMALQLLVGTRSSLKHLVATVSAAAALNAPVKSLIDSVVMGRLDSDGDRHQFGRIRLWGQVGFGIGSSLVGSLLSAFPDDDSSGRLNPSASVFTATSSDPTLEKVVHNIEVGIEVESESDAAAETAAIFSSNARTAFFDMTCDLLGRPRPLRGYVWAFVTHAIFSIPAFFCVRAFQPEKGGPVLSGYVSNIKRHAKGMEERKKTDIMNGLRLLAGNSDTFVFFFLAFVIGTSSGCIENFAYVRVREVGGTGNHMGVLRLVSSLTGAPMFWFSGPVTEALGLDAVLVLSLLAYSARFLNYALMGHPYHALPAEALRGMTFALFWSSGSMYAYRISPPGMNATMLLIMNAMYGGLGQSLGAVIGGRMQSKWGTARTFVYSGIFDLCFVCALLAYLAPRKERAFPTPPIRP